MCFMKIRRFADSSPSICRPQTCAAAAIDGRACYKYTYYMDATSFAMNVIIVYVCIRVEIVKFDEVYA